MTRVDEMAIAVEAPEERRLADAAATSEAAWQRLWLRARAITPSGLARIVLATPAVLVVGGLLLSAWRSLLPFQVGLVLAYLVLPIVDLLDRALPRWLAALVVVLGEIVVIVAFVGLLVPPLTVEAPQLVGALPTADQVRSLLADARALLTSLPPEVQALIANGLQVAAGQLRTNTALLVQFSLAVVAASVFGLLSTLGFILSFVAVPTWLLAVLTDRKAGTRAVDRILPDWLRPDLWAVVRIFDRTFGWYLRGQIVRSVIFGCGLYAAFVLLNRYGLATMQFPLSLAVFAAVAYLIPDIGPLLGAVPVALIALLRTPHEALIVLAAYLGVALLEQRVVAPRIENRSIDIHPAVLLPLLVAISQFGFLWVVIGGPLVVVARDLFRYTYGRFDSPPRPAGWLLQQPRRAPVRTTSALRPRVVSTPSPDRVA